MSEIRLEREPAPERLDQLGVSGWSIWTKEVSDFPWRYEDSETCYFLEGDVTVTPEGGPPVRMGRGDLVTFPAGMACRWQVHAPVRKHYVFGVPTEGCRS
ncbi:cupin domain-containing protein [Ectothiorhodospiraceae bacterium 2226]|nr:cupin domain-containing protein [Ectothiorhodospiraceae bacterium 2226]